MDFLSQEDGLPGPTDLNRTRFSRKDGTGSTLLSPFAEIFRISMYETRKRRSTTLGFKRNSAGIYPGLPVMASPTLHAGVVRNGPYNQDLRDCRDSHHHPVN